MAITIDDKICVINEDLNVISDGTTVKVIDKYNRTIATSTTSRGDIALQAALDNCPDNGSIVISADLYIQEPVTGTKSVSIRGVGGSITIDDDICIIEDITDHFLQDKRALIFEGGIGSQFTIGSDVTIGDTSLTLATTVGLSDGDLLKITDSTSNGEIVKIREVSSTTVVILFDSILVGYTTANSAIATQLVPISVNIEDLDFIGDPDVDTYAISITRGENCKVTGCVCANNEWTGIGIDDCYNTDIIDNRIYGRSGGNGISITGGSKRARISGNRIAGCGTAIRIHCNMEYLLITGNKGYPGEIGIYLNELFRCTYGVHIGYGYTCYIKYNEFDTFTRYIYSDADTLVISNNTFKNVKSMGIFKNVLTMTNYNAVAITDNDIHFNSTPATARYAIYIDTDYCYFRSFVVDGNQCFGGCIAYMRYQHADNLSICNNVMHYDVTAPSTAYTAIYLRGMTSTRLANVKIDGNFINSPSGGGISLVNVSGSCCNNKIWNVGRIAAGTNYGILLQQTGSLLLSVVCEGNHIETSVADFMKYGIGEVAADVSKVTNIIRNNYIKNPVTSDYLMVGTYTTGLTKSGVTLNVAWNGTIAHGLGTTPKWAIVTPSTASEFASVTTLDATDITVSVKKHDDNNGTQQNLYWSCGM